MTRSAHTDWTPPISTLLLTMSKYAPHRASTNNPRATSSTICQKCLGRGAYKFLFASLLLNLILIISLGHFIYECKSTRPYVSRPSRTEMLKNPRLAAKLRNEGKPSVEVPEEFKQKYVYHLWSIAYFFLTIPSAGVVLQTKY